MKEEIPIANPPLSAKERATAASLTDEELRDIDASIMLNCSVGWLKVARVVGLTADALKHRYPSLSYIFYSRRLRQLVKAGELESQGNLSYMRFSEVRIRSEPNARKSQIKNRKSKRESPPPGRRTGG